MMDGEGRARLSVEVQWPGLVPVSGGREAQAWKLRWWPSVGFCRRHLISYCTVAGMQAWWSRAARSGRALRPPGRCVRPRDFSRPPVVGRARPVMVVGGDPWSWKGSDRGRDRIGDSRIRSRTGDADRSWGASVVRETNPPAAGGCGHLGESIRRDPEATAEFLPVGDMRSGRIPGGGSRPDER